MLNLENKKINIVIADPSSQTRLMVAQSLRTRGYENVEPVGTLVEARRLMHAKSVDWFITAMFSRDKDHAIKFLDLFRKGKRPCMHVSLLVETSERKLLDRAFAGGLLSFHEKPFNKETLADHWDELGRYLKSLSNNGSLTAGIYLRRHLERRDAVRARIDFERNLAEVFEDESAQLLHLAEAYFKDADLPRGLATLNQAKIADPDLSAKIAELYREYADRKGDGQRPDLGVRKAAVIDSDSAVCHQVEEILKSLQVETVESFENGEEAMEWIERNRDVQLIIQEWKVPRLSGPALLNRLRDLKLNCPVMVVSSLMQKSDYPLLSEMGVSNMVGKPFTVKELVLAISWSLREHGNPTEQKSLEIKIHRSLDENRLAEAKRFAGVYQRLNTVPPARKRFVQALIDFHEEKYEDSKQKLLHSLKLAGFDSLMTLNLLGKCLLKLGDHEAALKCLQKAQAISPANIERLCRIADIEMSKGQGEKASEAITQAQSIDKDSDRVVNTQVRMAISSDDLKTAHDLMQSLPSIKEVIATLNNRAVVLIRQGRIDEAIDTYKKSIDAIPKKHVKMRPIVLYNLGLAMVRAGNLNEATKALNDCVKISSRVEAKAHSLLERVIESLTSGEPIQLNESPRAVQAPVGPPGVLDLDLDIEEESLLGGAPEEETEPSADTATSPSQVDETRKDRTWEPGCGLVNIYQPKISDDELDEMLKSA